VPKEETRTQARVPSFARWAFAGAALLLALVLLAGGCGRQSPTNTIDVGNLQHELSRVMHEQYLYQGFDYVPTVTCTATGALSYNCVGTYHDDQGVQAQSETVTCSPPSAVTGQRCYTGSGLALQ
jgi:hypothetical protein